MDRFVALMFTDPLLPKWLPMTARASPAPRTRCMSCRRREVQKAGLVGEASCGCAHRRTCRRRVRSSAFPGSAAAAGDASPSEADCHTRRATRDGGGEQSEAETSKLLVELAKALRRADADGALTLLESVSAWRRDRVHFYQRMLHAFGEHCGAAAAEAVLRLTLKRRSTVGTPSIQMYSSLMQLYCDERQTREVERLFRELSRPSNRLPPPTRAVFNTLILARGRAGDSAGAYRAFQELLASGGRPSASASGLGVSDGGTAPPDDASFNNVLRALAADGTQLERLRDVFQAMCRAANGERSSVAPSAVTYAIVIGAYAEQGRHCLPLARAAWRDMRHRRVPANTAVYNAMLRAIASDVDVEKQREDEAADAPAGTADHQAEESSRMLRQGGGERAADRLSGRAAGGGALRAMCAMLEDMDASSVPRDADTYSILLSAYGAARDIPRMDGLLAQLREARAPPPPRRPAPGHTSWSDRPAAMHSGERGGLSRLPLSRATYAAVVRGYARAGAVKKVEQLLAEMKRGGMYLDVDEYNSLIDALRRAGCHATAALAVYADMRATMMAPNADTLGALLPLFDADRAFTSPFPEHDDLESGESAMFGDNDLPARLREELRGAAVALPTPVALRFLRWSVQRGDIPAAERELEELLLERSSPPPPSRAPPSGGGGAVPASAFYPLLRVYAQRGDAASARRAMQHMSRLGCEPTTTTLRWALYAAVRGDDAATLAALLRYARRRALRVPRTALHELRVARLAARGELNSASALLARVKSPSVRMFNALLRAFAANGHADRAKELMRELRRARVEPNARTYAALLGALVRAKRVDEAVEELQMMRRKRRHGGTTAATATEAGWAEAYEVVIAGLASCSRVGGARAVLHWSRFDGVDIDWKQLPEELKFDLPPTAASEADEMTLRRALPSVLPPDAHALFPSKTALDKIGREGDDEHDDGADAKKKSQRRRSRRRRAASRKARGQSPNKHTTQPTTSYNVAAAEDAEREDS